MPPVRFCAEASLAILSSSVICPLPLYLTFLSLVAIWSAHRAESRVREISKKVVQLNELESEYLEAKSNLMKMGTESSVRQRSHAIGLIPSHRAPARITAPADE